MPLCTLHLLSLQPTTSLPTFLTTLKTSNANPLLISRVIRWIILPSQLSTPHLLGQNIKWDLLVVLSSSDALPKDVTALVQHHWRITAGVPGRLVNGFEEKNAKLICPEEGSVPSLGHPSEEGGGGGGRQVDMAQSSQTLELSPELNTWINGFEASAGKEGSGAVSMFNLLAFKDGRKEEYLKYGKAFGESVGKKFGGDAKIVGNVVVQDTNSSSSLNDEKTPKNTVRVNADGGKDGWDEIAIAHYPSISHFRAMLRDEGYQEANQRHRVPSLRDTAILMTSEVGVWGRGGESKGRAKL